MKLRILKNYIRLRLSQSELNEFEQTGKVISETNFSNGALTYELISDESSSDVTADLQDGTISVKIPTAKGKNWMLPEEVGLENEDQSQMRILIEKDFQCLHKRSGEDETDNFPNPLAE